jgi:hypothetical protein
VIDPADAVRPRPGPRHPRSDRAVIGAFLGVALDETVIHEAMETVAAADAVEPQQVIAQQRQFFLLT